MNTSSKASQVRRHRRHHSAEFKAEVVAACRKPRVSMAAVALDYRLNANLVRRWVVAAERVEHTAGVPRLAPPASAAEREFVPVAMQPSVITSTQEIVIELRRGSTLVKLNWPVSAAAACATWLSELLR